MGASYIWYHYNGKEIPKASLVNLKLCRFFWWAYLSENCITLPHLCQKKVHRFLQSYYQSIHQTILPKEGDFQDTDYKRVLSKCTINIWTEICRKRSDNFGHEMNMACDFVYWTIVYNSIFHFLLEITCSNIEWNIVSRSVENLRLKCQFYKKKCLPGIISRFIGVVIIITINISTMDFNISAVSNVSR